MARVLNIDPPYVDRAVALRAAAGVVAATLDALEERGGADPAARVAVGHALRDASRPRKTRRIVDELDEFPRLSAAAFHARVLGGDLLGILNARRDDWECAWLYLVEELADAFRYLGVPRPRTTARATLASAVADAKRHAP